MHKALAQQLINTHTKQQPCGFGKLFGIMSGGSDGSPDLGYTHSLQRGECCVVCYCEEWRRRAASTLAHCDTRGPRGGVSYSSDENCGRSSAVARGGAQQCGALGARRMASSFAEREKYHVSDKFLGSMILAPAGEIYCVFEVVKLSSKKRKTSFAKDTYC